MFAAFGTGQVLWSIFWFFIFFIWIMLLFHVLADIFRSPDLGGLAKTVWLLVVILLPYFGVFVYIIARGDKMQEHAIAQLKAQQAAQEAYIRSVVQNDPAGA